MFIPIDRASWPAEGEVRDLRVSLNAPVLLGSGPAPQPTRAALGWLPADDGCVVRLWLRQDDGEAGPDAVRGFDLPEAPLGPAARAEALERAERFLGGLGFLFDEAPTRRSAAPAHAAASTRSTEAPNPRASDPDPADVPRAHACADGARTAVRADVRLSKLRRRAPSAAAHEPRGEAP